MEPQPGAFVSFSHKENYMRKSVLFFILAVVLILGFIVATPYYYAVTPENRGTETQTNTQ